MPQIDLKIIAATALILGLFAGFYIDNTLLSKPRIDTLTQTITEQTTTITTLETQLDTLDDEHNTLQALYDQLNTNNVPLSWYTELEQQNEEQETTIATLETQVASQLSSIDTLETAINERDTEIQNLEDQLDTLQNKYNAVVNPLYVVFTLEDLNVNLTIDTDTYPSNSDITGTITITHANGAPFTGSFKLTLNKLYPSAGTPSEFYEIHGAKIYTWDNPFILGAGSYKLALSEIKDSLGVTILTTNQLKPYAIYLFEG